MSVIWEVDIRLSKLVRGEKVATTYRFVNGDTRQRYDTEEAAQAAYVDAVKQLGREQ